MRGVELHHRRLLLDIASYELQSSASDMVQSPACRPRSAAIDTSDVIETLTISISLIKSTAKAIATSLQSLQTGANHAQCGRKKQMTVANGTKL